MTVYTLYLKTHNKTGLKYLGKTAKTDPHTYTGSGVHWLNHLKKHGYDYYTEILFQSSDTAEFSRVCLEYSDKWSVKESIEFANMKPEDGYDGGALPGKDHPLYGRKRPRQSILMTGENNPAKRQEHKDNHHTKSEEWREAQRKRWEESNPMFDPEVRKKVSEKLKGPRPNARKPKKKIQCEHCKMMVAPHILNRWHNDNCKARKYD
jgi:hypothetical protein